MFGLDLITLSFVLLAGLAAGGVAYAFLFERIETERQSERRFKTIRDLETNRSVALATRSRDMDADKRRRNLQEKLNKVEDQAQRNKDYLKTPPLDIQIMQAGLDLSLTKFYLFSIGFGVVVTIICYILGVPLPIIMLPFIFLVATLGIPRWVIGHLRTKRVKAFLKEFPNALDVIVRAVKSGLPLNDGIRLIATEAQEPVKKEFSRVVEAQQMGMSVPDAIARMTETMPCSEVNFFGIVIQIQQQAGGNLSEALGNLSKVLRDRKKMKDRVSALSMEAKASAVIIGSLPIIVSLLIQLASPGYLNPLFETTFGNILLAGSAVWMGIGIFVMRTMMDFEV